MTSKPLQLVSTGTLPDEVERLSNAVIGLAMQVHTNLGPGLLERVYEDALAIELRESGIMFQRQIEVPVVYKGQTISPHVLDLLVGGLLVIELKAVKELNDIHTAQLLSYLRVTDLPLGLLFNFHALQLRQGMKRVLNARWSKLHTAIPHPPINK